MNKLNMNRLLSILLTIIMVLTIAPGTVFAVGEPPELLSAEVTPTGHVELTFDQAMAAPNTGAAGFLVVGYGSQNKNVMAAQLDGGDPTKILLTLGITIKGGEAPWLDYTPGTVAAADGGLLAGFANIEITNTLPHPTLDMTALLDGTVGTLYTHTFTATDGTAPYYFNREIGSLPVGLSINQATGVLSGTPTIPGTFAFDVRVLDSNSAFDRESFSLKINPMATNVCTISGGGSYSSLAAALLDAEDGQTITLLQNINHNQGIVIDSETITLNLAGYALNVTNSGGTGLEVKNGGKLLLFDSSGAFNVTGSINGVHAVGTGSEAEVTCAEGTYGAYAYGGGRITVRSNAIGNGLSGIAANARDGGLITVMGNAAGGGYGVFAADSSGETNASVSVGGDVSGEKGICITGNDGSITGVSVTGDVIATGSDGNSYGVYASGSDAYTEIEGDVTATECLGAWANNGAEITISGGITATDYIIVGSTSKTASEKSISTTKPDYYTYTDSISTVWVKDTTSSGAIPSPARIAAGSGFSLYLKEDGTVWAWGGNVNGQLGRGTTSAYPYDIPEQVSALSNVKSVAAGHVFSLALKEDGTVWAWGTNGNGQLGLPHPATTYSATPVQVGGLSGIQAISAGYRFCLALDDNGDVWAWGNNTKGQLGQAAAEKIHTPGKVPGLSNIIAISAGYMHSLALDSDGKVWAWGSNYCGELGNGTVEPTSTNPTPIQVILPGSVGVNTIYAAFQNSMLITDTGAVYGWGYNSEGPLGDGTNIERTVPTLTSYTEVSALGGTGAFYIALKNDGTVMGSGRNSFLSELINYGSTPVPINGLTGITEISQGNGGNHALALDSSGDVWAWGSNSSEECAQNTDYYGEPKKVVPPVKVQFPGDDISAASVLIAVPAAGSTPQTAAQVQSSTNHADYTVTGLIWNEALTGTGKFKPGQVYTATITLTSKNGKKFQSAAFTPTVAGTASVSQTATTGSSTGNTVTFTVTYGQTAAATYSIGAITNQTMTELTAGYASGTQQTKTISVTKTGTGDLTNLVTALSGSDADRFILTQPALSALDDTTPFTTFTVKAKDGLAAGTYSAVVTVSSTNMNDVTFTVTQVVRASGGITPDNGSGSGGGSTPVTSYEAKVTGSGTANNLPVSLNTGSNNATVTAGPQQGGSIMEGAPVVIEMPKIPGVNSYTLEIQVDYLSASDSDGALTLTTDTGGITMPANMLANTDGEKAKISISKGDFSSLSGDVKAAIGSRPLVQLTLMLDGRQAEWNNPDAPVTVTIPYKPTADELGNPEGIIIWYIEGSGNPICVPNGRYDPITGSVTFTTTHFSDYAVVYNNEGFSDVKAGAWYCKPIHFIAARDITAGTGGGNFSPNAKLTRGQFIVMLMNAYSIAPDNKPMDSFSDAGNTYYTGYLAAAKRLGITNGVGNNMFAPAKEITRQEMFTLLYNALKAINKLPETTSVNGLTVFSDAAQVKAWAKDAITLLADSGTIGGSAGKLNPDVATTRAEMAQVLYHLLSK